MILFFQPLLHKDDHEHCGQHKVQPFGVKVDEGAEQTSERGAEEPVEMVQKRHEEHEPAFVHLLRDIGCIIDGKAFIAHSEDEIKGFPSVSAVFFQHGDTVEEVPGVDHEGHGESLQRTERPEQEIHGHELHAAGEDGDTHQHGINK